MEDDPFMRMYWLFHPNEYQILFYYEKSITTWVFDKIIKLLAISILLHSEKPSIQSLKVLKLKTSKDPQAW